MLSDIKKINKKYLGTILVCFAASLWGFDAIVLTPRLFHLKVPFVVFMVHCLPFLVMSIFIGKREIKNIVALPKNDIIFYFLVALFGGCVGTLSIVKSLFLVNFQHLTVVTLLQKAQPIFALILARIVLKEKLGKNFLNWVLFALIGGYIMTFEFSLPRIAEVSSGNIIKACMFAMLAAFSFGSATVFGKRILSHSSFVTALYTRYFFTTMITFCIVIANNQLGWIYKVTPFEWMIFVIIGITSGSGAILLYYRGLRYIDASVATICELAFPISSVIFDYIFNRNLLSPVQFLGAACLVFAILKISKNQK